MTASFRTFLVLTGALVLTAPHAGSATLHAAPAPRILTTSIPAATLTHLDLTALDGSVSVSASPDPAATAIMVSVTLDPPRMRNFRRRPAADLSQVELSATADRNIARVGLTHAAEGTIEATWTIVVPARFSARVDAHDGDVTVTGIEGGVDAALNSGLGGHGGHLRVDVPRGRLLLSVGVGDVTAHRRSAEFDRAEVRSTVGDASLFLLGHEIHAPHAPGPGHRVTLDGSGPDVIRARVSVGDVSLHIG